MISKGTYLVTQEKYNELKEAGQLVVGATYKITNYIPTENLVNPDFDNYANMRFNQQSNSSFEDTTPASSNYYATKNLTIIEPNQVYKLSTWTYSSIPNAQSITAYVYDEDKRLTWVSNEAFFVSNRDVKVVEFETPWDAKYVAFEIYTEQGFELHGIFAMCTRNEFTPYMATFSDNYVTTHLLPAILDNKIRGNKRLIEELDNKITPINILDIKKLVFAPEYSYASKGVLIENGVSVTITGVTSNYSTFKVILKPNTKYFVKADVSNSAGSYLGIRDANIVTTYANLPQEGLKIDGSFTTEEAIEYTLLFYGRTGTAVNTVINWTNIIISEEDVEYSAFDEKNPFNIENVSLVNEVVRNHSNLFNPFAFYEIGDYNSINEDGSLVLYNNAPNGTVRIVFVDENLTQTGNSSEVGEAGITIPSNAAMFYLYAGGPTPKYAKYKISDLKLKGGDFIYVSTNVREVNANNIVVDKIMVSKYDVPYYPFHEEGKVLEKKATTYTVNKQLYSGGGVTENQGPDLITGVPIDFNNYYYEVELLVYETGWSSSFCTLSFSQTAQRMNKVMNFGVTTPTYTAQRTFTFSVVLSDNGKLTLFFLSTNYPIIIDVTKIRAVPYERGN